MVYKLLKSTRRIAVHSRFQRVKENNLLQTKIGLLGLGALLTDFRGIPVREKLF